MHKRRIVPVIAVMLAVLMLLSLVFSALPVIAHADTVTQAQVDEIQAQKNELSAKTKQSEDKLTALQQQHASVLEQKEAMDEKCRIATEQIALTQQQIELYDQMIAQKGEEVDAAKQAEEKQLEKYRTRVRAMEENGGYSFNIIALICNVRSLSELITIIDDVREIMLADKLLEEKYIEAREAHEAVKAEYETIKAGLEAKQTELESEKQDLEKQIVEAYTLIAELEKNIEKAKEEYAVNEAKEAAMSGYLSELSRQLWQEQEARRLAEEERRKQEAAETEPSEEPSSEPTQPAPDAPPEEPTPVEPPSEPQSSGGFSPTWPVPSCKLITSRYGWRTHPIYGDERFHAGVDIGAADGSTIVAAESGRVAISTYSDSYGNYIMLEHDDGYTSVYAHIQNGGLLVSKDQYVNKGDAIGLVGSTGWSTGPHCHFEIRHEGNTEDPTGYFSGLSYWNC